MKEMDGGGQENVVAIMVCNMSKQLSWLQRMDHIDTEHTIVLGGGMHASVKCENCKCGRKTCKHKCVQLLELCITVKCIKCIHTHANVV